MNSFDVFGWVVTIAFVLFVVGKVALHVLGAL